jgi:Bacterial TniB protein
MAKKSDQPKTTPPPTFALKSEAAEALTWSHKERKHFIMTRLWVPYPAADEAITELETLLEHPHEDRVPGMSLIAHTSNGKSRTLEEFIRRNPPDDADRWEGLHRPIVHATAPKDCDLRVLFQKILEAMGVPFESREREPVLRYLVFHHLERVEARMLVLDEFHNAMAGSPKKQPAYLNQIKEFCVDLHLPVVVSGNEKVPMLLRHVEELSNRLEPRVLPRWAPGADLQKLLRGIEERLPFPERSYLNSPEVATHLYERCGGLGGGALLGEIMRVIRLAACAAVDAGEPNVSLKRLQSIRRPPPESRWDEALAALAPVAPLRTPVA